MPELLGKAITRAEESARHAYRRALERSLRPGVKGTGWASAQGSIFRADAGWFFTAAASVSIFERVTKALVSVKPMAIDPIFWDIVGLPENRDLPLSFRANGFWACHPPYFAEVDLEEDEDPALVGARLITVATRQLEIVKQSYSLERFITACRNAESIDGAYLPSIVAALIASDRQDEALSVCDQARLQGLSGGFQTADGSFIDRAIAFLQN